MDVSQQDNQYIIRIPMEAVDAPALEKLLRQIRLQEILSKRQGTEEQADELARELNNGWWDQNKHRFLK